MNFRGETKGAQMASLLWLKDEGDKGNEEDEDNEDDGGKACSSTPVVCIWWFEASLIGALPVDKWMGCCVCSSGPSMATPSKTESTEGADMSLAQR
jgi:hypothetical protein